MAADELLPTEFAIALMEECNFMEKKGPGINLVKRNKLLGVLQDFQRMAICSSFDDSVLAFHGIELTAEQIDALKVIHKSTKSWVMGLTVGACLDAVTYRSLKSNEFAEAIKMIRETTEDKTQGKGIGRRMQGILLRLNKKD